jgi:hypothetical protein
MLKKSLFLGAAALALLVLVVLGCSNPASETSSAPQLTPDGLVIDAAVNTAAAFEAILDDPNIRVILFDLDGADKTLSVAGLAIPPEKTVYLVNNGYDPDDPDPRATVAALIPTGISGLNIRGTLIVGRGVALRALDNSPISLWSTGSVQVQDDGFLVTDKRIYVSNYTDQGASKISVLGTNVRFLSGSTLVIDDEPELTAEDITKLLAILTPGTIENARMAGPTGESRLVLSTSYLEPSQLAAIPGRTSGQSLIATSLNTESAVDFTIPAGVVITAAYGDRFFRLTNLTVNGTFIAAGAEGNPEGVTLTVNQGGNLTVGTITKLKAPSSIAAGGAFSGFIAGFDTGAVLAVAAGGTINGYTLATASNVNTVTVAGGGALTVNEAKTVTADTPTVILPNSDVTFNNGVTVDAGATLTIAKDAEVTVSGGNLTLNGTVEIPGSLTIDNTATTPTVTGKVNIQDGGNLTLEAGIANGDLKGIIEIQSGAVLKDLQPGGGSLWGTDGTGSFVFKAGAKGYRGTSPTTLVIGAVGDAAAIVLEKGALTLKKSGYELDGEATLQAAFPVFTTETLDIKSGSILTIDGSIALTINGKATIAGTIKGGSSSTIVVGNAAETAVTISGTSNFYPYTGTTPLTTLDKGKTYQWTTDVDGSTPGDQSGWKATSA